MNMPTIYVLLGGFLAPLAVHFLSKTLRSGQPHKDEIDHAIEILPRIHGQLPTLLNLNGKARSALCQAIAKDIRNDCVFVTWTVYRRLQFADRRPPAPSDIQHPASAVLNRVRRLDRDLRRTLLLARRRPDHTTIARHLTYAAMQHTRVWIEYLRFLRDLYPDHYPGLIVPGEPSTAFTISPGSPNNLPSEQQFTPEPVSSGCLSAK